MPFSFPASPSVGQTSVQNGRTYVWTSLGTWELTGNVAGHSATHASGGSDAITPSSIGAAAASHTHTAAAITSGTLANARLTTRARASMNLYLWSAFR